MENGSHLIGGDSDSFVVLSGGVEVDFVGESEGPVVGKGLFEHVREGAVGRSSHMSDARDGAHRESENFGGADGVIGGDQDDGALEGELLLRLEIKGSEVGIGGVGGILGRG